MLVTTTAPVTTIMPGGCLPPWITPTLPTEPKPWERNCWDPTKWNLPTPTPAGDRQAIAAAAALR